MEPKEPKNYKEIAKNALKKEYLNEMIEDLKNQNIIPQTDIKINDDKLKEKSGDVFILPTTYNTEFGTCLKIINYFALQLAEAKTELLFKEQWFKTLGEGIKP
jgi:hypothetical protein